MKIAKWIFIVTGTLLTVIWLWPLTPANVYMPDLLKEFMIIFGHVLTYLVPMMVAIMLVIWLDGRNRKRNPGPSVDD